MSFNLTNKVNNLTTLINSTIPSSGVVVATNLTATTGAITNLASTTISSGTLTCGNINGTLTYNLNPASGMSVPLSGPYINMILATPNANNYLVGQMVFVQGNSNGYFNNITYTIQIISSPYIIQLNNPTSIPSLEVGGGGTVSGGIITTRDLTATNLNGKLNVVGGTSNSGNVILCNNTTSTSGNFDLLTDSNQHLRFAGGSNLLTIGGATNGGIAIPGTAGSIVCNQYTTNASTKMILNSTEANGLIEIQKSGSKIGNINYGNSSYPLQMTSIYGMSLDTQANGNINVACDGTGILSLIAQSGVVRASFSGTSTTIGLTSAQAITFVNASGNAINFYTSGYPIFAMGTYNCTVSHALGAGVGIDFITFYYNGVAIGSVYQNSASSIVINNTSDYRLKENIQPINDCLTVLNKLKPISFNWKDGGEYTLGFLAHEFAEVFPNNVVGQKDAVDADGKNKYQQMSDVCCIPLLVSCVQEQNKIIVDMRKELDDLKLLVNQLLNK